MKTKRSGRKFGQHSTRRAKTIKRKKLEAMKKALEESKEECKPSLENPAAETSTASAINGSQPVIKPNDKPETSAAVQRQVCSLEGIREGRMVIDRLHFANSMANVCRHSSACPKGGHLSFVRIDILGLNEQWHFKCYECQHSVTFSNTSPSSGNIEPNKSVVWAMRLIGCGRRQLQRISSVTGLRCVSQTTYRNIELTIDDSQLPVNK